MVAGRPTLAFFPRRRPIPHLDHRCGRRKPSAITSATGNYDKPSWSRDGASIDFGKAGAKNRVDVEAHLLVARDLSDVNIWRIPAAGGPAEQVTQSRGVRRVGTTDGKALVYSRVDRSGSACSRHSRYPADRRDSSFPAPTVSPWAPRACITLVPSRGAAVAFGSQKPMNIRLIDPAKGHDRAGDDVAGSIVRLGLPWPERFARWQHDPVHEGSEPRRGSDDDREFPLAAVH